MTTIKNAKSVGAARRGKPGGTSSANTEAVKEIVRAARRARLDYDAFNSACQQARRKLGLKKPRKARRLPRLLPEADLRRFFETISSTGDVQHEFMLKFLFYTGLRVSKLVSVRVSEVDLEGCKVFIDDGKGSKDRYILFPTSFRLVLRAHLDANSLNRFLFETRRFGPFTVRRVQQIVTAYRVQAGIEASVHPHLLRHQVITFLTSSGLSDAQIQLISGHASKRSLEVYQHLSLESVERDYQRAMRSAPI